MTAVLSQYAGSVDFHYVETGLSALTFITSLLGTAGIIGISMAIAHTGILKKIMMAWGKNSLFVMATHEYFMLKNLIMAGIMFIFPAVSGKMEIAIEIIGIIILEWILFIVLAPVVERLVNKIEGLVDNLVCKTVPN